jgi:subtilisin family serine protease
MVKRGELRRVVPLLTVIVLLAFLYLSSPVAFKTGPTGLQALGPVWTGQVSRFVIPEDGRLTIDLAASFASDRPLTFLASRTDKIATWVEGTSLIIEPTPGFVGERIITIYASDGEAITRKRIKVIVAASEAEQPFVPASQPIKVEPQVESILARDGIVDAIIVLQETAPFTFSTAAAKHLRQQLLEQRRQHVDQAQDALLAKVNDVPAGNAITGAAVTDVDLEIVREYDTVNALAVKLTRSGLAKLRADPAVAQILLDRPFQAFLTESVPLIDANDVWNLTANSTNVTGKGEVVCILDTGIDLTHSAFTGKIVGGYDYVNEDSSPQDDAANSHGTHVSGIAVGNSSAVKGVAPDARVVPVKVCNSGNSCDASDILAGIDYCNNNSVTFNVTAISGSLGDSGQYTSATCPSLFDSALNTSVALGIVPVFASGNNGYTGGVSYPSCSPYAISIGSVSDGDSVSGFSNRGGDRFDVFAPGESVVSSTVGGGTGSLSGTSMATPHVAGAIALIQHNQRAQNKAILTLAEMRQILKETGKQVSSWHRIDVYAAIVKLNQNYTINITDNSVTNSTPPKAKVKFKDATDLSDFTECSQLKQNLVEIDSVNCPQYNKSAHIVFEGLPGINATPLRNGQSCPATICQNATFSNGTLEFDVTSFTNYSSESQFTVSNVAGCAVINASASLTANVVSNTTCFTINASNLFLNCTGFSISYGMDGTQNQSFGILADNKTNLTIKDCSIRDINASGAFGVAINLTHVNESIIVNTTIQTNGTNNNNCIFTLRAYRNIIENNTLRTHGTEADNDCVYLQNGSSNNNITNNTIETNGSTSFNRGIRMQNTVENNTASRNVVRAREGIAALLVSAASGNIITNNTLVTNGSTDAHRGMLISTSASNNIVEDNTIVTDGNGSLNNGILFIGSNNNVSRNTIITNGTAANHGIWIQSSSSNNLLDSNNITARGSESYGVYILSGSGSLFNNTILNGAEWINSSAGNLNNFSNTTFAMGNGSIRVFGIFQVNGSQNINQTRLNITSNRAFLNSTNLTFLNTSAQVTLFDINVFDPKPLVDFDDDGASADCPQAICQEVSYNLSGNKEFVFNVTQFTAYSSNDATVFSCNVTINVSTRLTQNLSGNTSCITIGSDNLTFNCAGNTIFYDGAGLTQSQAIIAGGRTNVTVQDCILRDINSSGSLGIGINFTLTNNSLIRNMTIFTNSSGLTPGISLNRDVYRIIIANNTITTGHGGGANNFGIQLTLNASENNISNNTIQTNGTTINAAILLQTDASNNSVIRNVIYPNGTGVGQVGIRILIRGFENRLENNTIITGGSSNNNFGIQLVSSAASVFDVANNIANGNTIRTTGTNDNHGIELTQLSARNTFDANNISTPGNGSHAITFEKANYSVFTNTFIAEGEWINATQSLGNNLTRTTFANANGSINITGLLQLNGTYVINKTTLNIRQNQAFLNSTNLTAFNQSARITLFNVSFTNPQPEADFQDDGTFAVCSASICSEVSYSGTTYIFDVTQFTAYAAGETTGGGGSGSPAPGGAAGGGGGSDKKKETSPATEQPAQVSPPNLNRFLSRQTAPAAPPAQEQARTLPEAAPEQPSNIATAEAELREPPINAQRTKRLFFTISLSLAFLAVIVISVYWFALHHRK